MRQAPTYTAWNITCHSAEEAQTLRQWLVSRIDLERIVTDSVRAAPAGVDQVQTMDHRLGDYFAAIRTMPDLEANPASFRLLFHRRPDARRFWKDLMVNILQEMETTPQTPSIAMASKGNVVNNDNYPSPSATIRIPH